MPPASALVQSNFEQGVACAMHLWSQLDDAVEDQLGGQDSADKRDWFVGSVVDLFPDLSKSREEQLRAGGPTEEPEQYDVEYRLVQVLDDEFELKLDDDDDSAYRLAEQILRIRTLCLEGSFGMVEELSKRFAEKESRRNKKKTRKVVVKEVENETDWDSEEDDSENEDDEMEDAPPLTAAPKEKPRPEVDEDGFTKVTKKNR